MWTVVGIRLMDQLDEGILLGAHRSDRTQFLTAVAPDTVFPISLQFLAMAAVAMKAGAAATALGGS